MLKKLLKCLDIPMTIYYTCYNKHEGLNNFQWNVIITVSHCCVKMPNELKQYYADLLMLELLEQGRL